MSPDSSRPSQRFDRVPSTTARPAPRTRDAAPVAGSRSSYRRSSSRYSTKGRRLKKFLIGSAVTVAVLGVLVGGGLALAHWTGIIKPAGPTDGDTTLISLTEKGDEAKLPTVNVDNLITGITGLPAADAGIATFSTTKKDFQISDAERAAISRAIANAEAILAAYAGQAGTGIEPAATAEPAEEAATEGEGAGEAEADETAAPSVSTANVALLAIDLTEGWGLSYNLDAFVEGGQSTKALFATFFASQFLDTARATADGDGALVVRALSDNGDKIYEQLRRAYDDQGWDAWIGGVGAKSSVSSAGYYPMSTVRMQARAWLNVYRYLTGNTAFTTWLGDLLKAGDDSLTKRAFTSTREIATAGQGEPITIAPLGCEMLIWSFGGHMNSYSTDTFCITESAIVLVGEKPYLISVMTGLPDTVSNRELVIDLIAAAGQALIDVPEPPVEPEAEAEPEAA